MNRFEKPQVNSVEKSHSANKTQMNLRAIKNGDFRSIVGVWQTINGDKIQFDHHGLVSKHQNLTITDALEDRLIGTFQDKALGFEEAAFVLLPKGATSPSGDIVQEDFILIGYDVTFAERFPYLRVSQ